MLKATPIERLFNVELWSEAFADGREIDIDSDG